MDPYIEHPDVWSDFHGALAEGVRAYLNARIRPRYVARLTPRVTYDVVEIDQVRGVARDVAVWRHREASRAPGGGPVAATPASAESAVELELPLRLYSVEVRATDSMELVTAIEILSPVNKRLGHEGYADYQRRELLRSTAHLMEVDLLRGGTRPPLSRTVPVSAYRTMLSRTERRPNVEVWALQLADPLPILPVPLRDLDPDALLDLRAVVAEVYERGGYEQLIDYRRDVPPPPLSETESAWVRTLLSADHSAR